MTTLPIKSLVAGCFALTITQPAVAYDSCRKGAGRSRSTGTNAELLPPRPELIVVPSLLPKFERQGSPVPRTEKRLSSVPMPKRPKEGRA